MSIVNRDSDKDVVDGTRGDDTIGGEGADHICGDGGADRILGAGDVADGGRLAMTPIRRIGGMSVGSKSSVKASIPAAIRPAERSTFRIVTAPRAAA